MPGEETDFVPVGPWNTDGVKSSVWSNARGGEPPSTPGEASAARAIAPRRVPTPLTGLADAFASSWALGLRDARRYVRRRLFACALGSLGLPIASSV